MKSDSVYLVKKGRTRYRVISNQAELVSYLKNRYTDIEIVEKDLSKLPIKDQLQEMQSVTIFISHPGGSCMILPFIPPNSHALLIDYLATEKDGMFGYKTGDSVSMEISFWNMFTHFEKMYYQVYSEDEMEWDVTGEEREKGWLRDDASVRVDLARVEFMINEMLGKHVFE